MKSVILDWIILPIIAAVPPTSGIAYQITNGNMLLGSAGMRDVIAGLHPKRSSYTDQR